MSNILVVDDDEDFAESLAIAIEGRGHTVDVVHSGEAALSMHQRNDYDILLMDVRLPGINGVASFLEMQRVDPKVKVVLMTGHSPEAQLNVAADNCAWKILRKPLDLTEVLKLVEQCTGGCVVVADDDDDFANQMEIVLEALGKHVVRAQNGAQALRHVRTHDVQLLVLDLRMPELGGLEAMEELEKAACALPTIVVSAYPDEIFGASGRLPSNDEERRYFQKPLDAHELLQAAQQMMAAPATKADSGARL